ncbi:MAG: hypothetical protein WA866_24775, partial [Pseudolabrys sp.]
ISRDVKFSKRGVTQQQLDADWSACRKENTVAMSFAETEPKRSMSYAEEYLHGCEGLHCDVVDKNPKAPAARATEAVFIASEALKDIERR